MPGAIAARWGSEPGRRPGAGPARRPAAGRPVLLVLDNFEHVLPAAAPRGRDCSRRCPRSEGARDEPDGAARCGASTSVPLPPLPVPAGDVDLPLGRGRPPAVRAGFDPGRAAAAALAESPPAGRDPAGDRAGGGPDPAAAGGRAAAAALERQRLGPPARPGAGPRDLPDAAAHAARHDRLELRPAGRRPSGALSSGCRSSSVTARWRRRRRSRPRRGRISSTPCPRWWRRAWSARAARTRAATRASACSARSGRTRGSGWRPAPSGWPRWPGSRPGCGTSPAPPGRSWSGRTTRSGRAGSTPSWTTCAR